MTPLLRKLVGYATMITTTDFENLSLEYKEKIISAFFNTKHPGFSSRPGVVLDTHMGYTVRLAALLLCEEQDEIVKKIFIFLHEKKEPLELYDIEEILEYLRDLGKAGHFEESRDSVVVVTLTKSSYPAYSLAKGKLSLIDFDTLIKGINETTPKKNKKCHELRNALRLANLRGIEE